MKYVIKRSDDNQYFFTIKAGNRRVLATSETYHRKASVYKAILAIHSGYIGKDMPEVVDRS